jgi:hypothetical protein
MELASLKAGSNSVVISNGSPSTTLESWALGCCEWERRDGGDIEKNSALEDLAKSSGLLKVPISVRGVGSGGQVGSVCFLLDFRTLWRHASETTVDEVAFYCPLFRMYMELCFHKRTVQVLVLTTAWYLVVTIIADIVYPAFDAFHQVIYYFYVVSAALVYIALAVLFKGANIFGDKLAVPGESSAASDDCRGMHKREIHKNPSISWRIRAMDAFRATLSELADLWRGAVSSQHTVSAVTMPQVSFYEALNIGLKFLSKRNRNDNCRTLFNSRAKNITLVMIFFFVPVYILLWNFFSMTGPINAYNSACAFDPHSALCKNFTLVIALTCGTLIGIIQKYIFMCAVLLSLIGLQFGSEVGRALVDSWISRFGMLRRVEPQSEHYHESGIETGDADSAGPTRVPSAAVVLSALHSHGSQPSATQAGLRVEFSIPASDVLTYVHRDAYEHYLFIREFMSNGSRAWSPIIITLAFLCSFYVLLFCYGAATAATDLTTLDWIYYSLWIVIRVLVLMVYPVVSLARANDHVSALQELFLVAAPEDFEVIGGRDRWLTYLEKVPAMWTVYGLWVTWEKVTGAVWAGVVTLGALAITYASSTLGA